MRANKSGCLDQCERGTTIVVYPDNVWYGGVTLEDVDEIIEEHIRKGPGMNFTSALRVTFEP